MRAYLTLIYIYLKSNAGWKKSGARNKTSRKHTIQQIKAGKLSQSRHTTYEFYLAVQIKFANEDSKERIIDTAVLWESVAQSHQAFYSLLLKSQTNQISFPLPSHCLVQWKTHNNYPGQTIQADWFIYTSKKKTLQHNKAPTWNLPHKSGWSSLPRCCRYKGDNLGHMTCWQQAKL